MLRAPLARLRRDGVARSVSACLAVLALMLQLGVPLAHDPVGMGAFAPWLGTALCHAGGGTADRPLPANHPAPSDPKAYLCPICISMQASGSFVAPPAGASVVAALPPPQPPSFPPMAVPIAHAPGFTAQPRAPPAA